MEDDQQKKKERHRTIYVAEATCLALFGMVQATRPVNGDITFIAVEPRSTLHTTAGADPAEFEQTVKNRAVITHVVFALLLREVIHVVGSNFRQKVNVLVRVELGHLVFGRRFGTLPSDSLSASLSIY